MSKFPKALADRFVDGTINSEDWDAITLSPLLAVQVYVQLQNRRNMPKGHGRADFVETLRVLTTAPFKVEVNTYADHEDAWSGNDIRHDTPWGAREAAIDLFTRWTAVKDWRTINADGQVIDTSRVAA